MEDAASAVVRREATRTWLVPGCAVVFAVLFVAGMMTSGAASDTENKTNAEVLKTFNDEKTGAIVGAFLLVLAGLVFLPLAWAAIRRISAGLSGLGDYVARSTALVFVGLTMVAAALFSTLAATVKFGSEDVPPAALVRFIPQMGYPVILIGGALTVGLFLAVVSRAGQVCGAVPAWFWVLGYVAAVAMLGGVMFLPMLLLPVWSIGAAFALRER